MSSIKARLLFFFLILAVSACSPDTRPCPKGITGDVVYIVEQGWHAEIGIPIEELSNDLVFYSHAFPGARVIMFGYGKKTFFTAPAETASEYLLGPFPGPAAIHVFGLRVTPLMAYPAEDTITLALPPGGRQALSAYIWKDLAKDISGLPRIVSHSTDPDGLFYAAESRYTLLHTCNTWTADALHAAGLPISAEGVTFSGQVMAQVVKTAQQQCQRLLGN